MGAFLLAAGKKEKSSLRHSRIMIHQPLGGARGQASDKIQADEILFLKRLNIELSERTGRIMKQLKKTQIEIFICHQ